MQSRTLLIAAASVLLAILGIWLWVLAPSVANGLSLTFACLILLYLYVVRLVVPHVKTNKFKLQFSIFDLSALVLATGLLVAHRRAPDAVAALIAWPCTSLMFVLHSKSSSTRPVATRRILFRAHAGFFVLAMVFSALVSFWLTTQWPYYADRPFEPPIFTFMLAPAVFLMMAIQADLAVNFLHPSLVAGILVSIAVALATAAITSWATCDATRKLSARAESSVQRDAKHRGRKNG